jgi:hypothetical protein
MDRTCLVSQDTVSWKHSGSRHDLSHFYSIMEQFCSKAIPTLVCSWCVMLGSMCGIFVCMNR